MDKFDILLQKLGLHIALIIAGIFGGVLSIGNRNGKLNVWQTVFVLGSGGATANYLTPVLAELVSINESTKYGFAFLLGFTGLEGVKFVVLKVKERYSKPQTKEQ